MTIIGTLYTVFLYTIVTTDAELECPLNRVRLIHSNEVATSNVQHGTKSFSSLLSPIPNFSDGYFFSFDTPNIGQLVFKEELVLLGLTTQGYEVSSTPYYVSDFTFQYSNSTDEPDIDGYETYPTRIITNSINEKSVFFPEPLLAKRLQLVINQKGSSSNLYYWRLNIFGCSKSEAMQKIIPTTSSESILITMITNTQTSDSFPVEMTVTQSPSAVIQEAQCSQNEHTVTIIILVLLVIIVIVIFSVIIVSILYKTKRDRKCSSVKDIKSSPLNTTTLSQINTNEQDEMMINGPYYYNSSVELFVNGMNSLEASSHSQTHSFKAYNPPTISLNSHSSINSTFTASSNSSDKVDEDEIENILNPSYSIL